jgi:hypothetical protein
VAPPQRKELVLGSFASLKKVDETVVAVSVPTCLPISHRQESIGRPADMPPHLSCPCDAGDNNTPLKAIN